MHFLASWVSPHGAISLNRRGNISGPSMFPSHVTTTGHKSLGFSVFYTFNAFPFPSVLIFLLR